MTLLGAKGRPALVAEARQVRPEPSPSAAPCAFGGAPTINEGASLICTHGPFDVVDLDRHERREVLVAAFGDENHVFEPDPEVFFRNLHRRLYREDLTRLQFLGEARRENVRKPG